MSNIVKYLRYHADKVAHIFAGQLVGLSALVFGWEIATLLVVLAGASKEVEQPASSHDWDDQDKCRRCGDRDWYASATCTPTTVEEADCLATWAGGLLVIGLIMA